eukprot:scaffold25318_cov117-Isochrysis_galbana.AAC.9
MGVSVGRASGRGGGVTCAFCQPRLLSPSRPHLHALEAHEHAHLAVASFARPGLRKVNSRRGSGRRHRHRLRVVQPVSAPVARANYGGAAACRGPGEGADRFVSCGRSNRRGCTAAALRCWPRRLSPSVRASAVAIETAAGRSGRRSPYPRSVTETRLPLSEPEASTYARDDRPPKKLADGAVSSTPREKVTPPAVPIVHAGGDGAPSAHSDTVPAMSVNSSI